MFELLGGAGPPSDYGRSPLNAVATLAKQARKLNCAAVHARRRDGTRLPALIMITDSKRLKDPRAAMRRLPRGSIVILRDYERADRETLARRLLRTCRRRGLLLLVAGSGELAARVRADGVHFPEGLARRAQAWRVRRPAWLITVAAHSLAAIRRARRFGADAALLSPAFPTESHPGAPSLGILRFSRLAHSDGLPVYALGGVTTDTARRLTGSGATGIAAIGVFTAPLPNQAEIREN